MIPRYHTGGCSSMGRTYTQNIQNLSKNSLLGQKKMECTICSDKMLLSSGTEMEKGIVAGWQLRKDKKQSQHMWNISHWHQQANNSAKSANMRPSFRSVSSFMGFDIVTTSCPNFFLGGLLFSHAYLLSGAIPKTTGGENTCLIHWGVRRPLPVHKQPPTTLS